MANTRKYGADPAASAIKLNFKMMQLNEDTGKIESYDHDLVRSQLGNAPGGYLMMDGARKVDVGENTITFDANIFSINAPLNMNGNAIALDSSAAITKGLNWAEADDWSVLNDGGDLILQGLTISADNDFNLTLSADQNPEGNTDATITINSELSLNNNDLNGVDTLNASTVDATTVNSDLFDGSNITTSDGSIDDLTSDSIVSDLITINGTFATGEEIIPPIFRLRQGQKLGGTQQGSQIQFSLYEFNSDRCNHYLTSTHSGSSVLSNRIDLYLCDTTEPNSLDSGVNHSFTFGASINRSRQALGMDGNNFNLEGGAIVFDTNNSLTKTGDNWEFNSFGAGAGNFVFKNRLSVEGEINLNSKRLYNASQVLVNDTNDMQSAANNAKGFFAPDNAAENIDVIAIVAGDEDKEARFYLSTPYNSSTSPFRTNAFKSNIISRGLGTWGRAEMHFCLNNTSGSEGGAGGTDANDPVNNASLSDSRFIIYPDGNIELVDGNFLCKGQIDMDTNRILSVGTPANALDAVNKEYVDDSRVYFAACDGDGNNTNDNLPDGISYTVSYDSGFTRYTYTFSQDVSGEGSAVGATADNGGLRVTAAFPDPDDVRVNPTGQSSNNVFVIFNQ